MKKMIVGALGAAALCVAGLSQAETQKIENVAYGVQMNAGQPVELPNGAKGVAGVQMHATVVSADGELLSQWCNGQQGTGPDGKMRSVGYCTVIADNGDLLWVSFLNDQGPGKPGTWTVIGGTGQYEGATGGGTTTMVSSRGDGRAWTSRSEGTIVTP